MSTTRAKTIPWSWYTDPAVLGLEQERIFRRFWQYVGLTSDIAEPRSFCTTRVGDVPVLLVRDEKGVLRAFPSPRTRASRGAGRR